VRQANHEFADLLSHVERGEEILITKRSEPVAVLSPYRPPLMAAERKKAIQHAIDVMVDAASLLSRKRPRAQRKDLMAPCQLRIRSNSHTGAVMGRYV